MNYSWGLNWFESLFSKSLIAEEIVLLKDFYILNILDYFQSFVPVFLISLFFKHSKIGNHEYSIERKFWKILLTSEQWNDRLKVNHFLKRSAASLTSHGIFIFFKLNKHI